jgi:hypothetical protein
MAPRRLTQEQLQNVNFADLDSETLDALASDLRRKADNLAQAARNNHAPAAMDCTAAQCITGANV